VEIFTIGFTQKSAEQFFNLLKAHGIRQLIDIRLNNSGQLAGFTKHQDLRYFLREICAAEYRHEVSLSPTKDLLDGTRAGRYTWQEYESIFEQLMVERDIANRLDPNLFSVPTVLLCSEATADHCHRRLVAEHLQRAWGNVTITHL
jgi:uncharacterized protein (DUF488 family)